MSPNEATDPREAYKHDVTASWSFQEGMVRLRLWPEDRVASVVICLTPSEALELIEQGVRTVSTAVRDLSGTPT